MTYQVLEPTWTGRNWQCSIVDLRTCAVVAETFGNTALEAECKAIGAAAFGNGCRSDREAAQGQGGQGR